MLEQNPGYLSAKVLETMLSTAWTDELTGLYPSDINKELYMGSDAPPPNGGVTPPPPPPAPTGPCYPFCAYESDCQYAAICGGCAFCQ